MMKTIKYYYIVAKLWIEEHRKLLITTFLVLFVAGNMWICAARPRTFQFRYDVSCVEKIEICKKIDEEGRRNEDPVEVLMTVDEADHEEVYAAILKIQSWNRIGQPLYGIGTYQFRVYYENGEIEIIGNTNNVYVSADGKWRSYDFIFDEGFEELILEILAENGIEP